MSVECFLLAIRSRLAMSELLPLYPQHATFQRQCRISASFRLLVLQLRAYRHGGVFVAFDPGCVKMFQAAEPAQQLNPRDREVLEMLLGTESQGINLALLDPRILFSHSLDP